MIKQKNLDFFQLKKDIENDLLKPVYLLYGEDNYLHEMVGELIKKYFKKNNKSINYETFYGENLNISNLISSIKTLPLGTDKQIISIKNIDKVNSSNSKKIDLLINNYSFRDNTIILLIFCLTKKMPKNISLKKITQFGQIVNLKKPLLSQVKYWINQKCNEYNIKITPDALYYFQSLTNNDLSKINNELEKIYCYLGNNSQCIKKEDIIKSIYGLEEGNIFNFVDAIGERKTLVALKILRVLERNEYHPLSLLAMINRQMKLIFQAKLYEADQKKLVSELRLPVFVVNNIIRQSHKYKLSRLKNSFRHLLDAEKKLKTGYFDPVLVLEQLVLKITN